MSTSIRVFRTATNQMSYLPRTVLFTYVPSRNSVSVSITLRFNIKHSLRLLGPNRYNRWVCDLWPLRGWQLLEYPIGEKSTSSFHSFESSTPTPINGFGRLSQRRKYMAFFSKSLGDSRHYRILVITSSSVFGLTSFKPSVVPVRVSISGFDLSRQNPRSVGITSRAVDERGPETRQTK